MIVAWVYAGLADCMAESEGLLGTSLCLAPSGPAKAVPNGSCHLVELRFSSVTQHQDK